LERAVVAFLNSSEGGVIYIGIENDLKIYGVENIDDTQLKIKDRIRNNISPSVMGLFDVSLEEYENKQIIKITIASGLEKPYFISKIGMTSKGCFFRVSGAAEQMPQYMIEKLFNKRIRNTIGNILSPRTDLTFEQLKIYYQEKKMSLNSSFMRTLELLTPEGKLNYAAYLLSDENGISIQVAKYADTTRVDLIENVDFGRCSLPKALYSVLDKMKVENTIYTKITYPHRMEREKIDFVALREAVVNAIVHNDYSNGASPKFEFFSDRLEIISAGGLPYGFNEEDFYSGLSSPRNKEIMRVFKDLGIVEHLGSGIPRIMEKYDIIPFEITDNFIKIVFKYGERDLVKGLEGSEDLERDLVKDLEGSEGIERDLEKLSFRAKNILHLIQKKPNITQAELSKLVGINEKNIRVNINKLKLKGLLRRVGSDKAGYWEVI
jgi:predicted HTH transcriptional regulator